MKPQPIRITRSRQHKQVSPNGLPIVYCGRGSKWGNPFRVVKLYDGKWSVKISDSNDQRQAKILVDNCRVLYDTKEEAAKDAVKCYVKYSDPYEHGGELEDLLLSELFLRSASDLKNKNLSCWCKQGETCHVDWLLKIAND